ncbi:YccV-like-domain-containing protein [Phlebopus sp. FC_14]|nr:YccV-like-domain-containing protein [Phlebopus sp. FC_14]
MGLKQLPFDVYVHILERLPVSAYSDDSPRTIAACLRSNSALREAASVVELWKPHYIARYTFCDAVNEEDRRKSLGNDWKLRYFERARLDRQAIRLLDLIVTQRDGRLQRAREITSSFSYDVWNALDAEAQCNIPEAFREDEDTNAGQTSNPYVSSHAIPRRFWAQSLLGAIARSHAVRIWSEIKRGHRSDSDSLEIAVACLSSYFSRPPMEVSSQLDVLGDQCRSYLIQKRLPVDPDEFNRSAGTLKSISSSICDFLWEKGFRAAEQSRFHIFNTRFPHWFLTTHKDTIPISLVYVFVCLCRRLKITAAPLDFPAKVLAIVSSPDPGVSDIFVDVFGSRTCALPSPQEDLPRLLMDAGVAPASMSRHVQPASTRSMIIRASRNILASFSLLSAVETAPEADLHAAFYVGLSVNLIFLDDPRCLLNIMRHIDRFPLDIISVLRDTLAPALSPQIQARFLDSCAEAEATQREVAASVTLRSTLATPVQYFVGTIFKHAKYDYIGYIYGWEPSCMASESWITSMNVDSLPRGRHQPFYHVLTQYGSARYVAEENVQATTLDTSAYQKILTRAPEAGRYFEGLVQANDRARLLPSPELLAAYPEDDEFAENWIRAAIES